MFSKSTAKKRSYLACIVQRKSARPKKKYYNHGLNSFVILTNRRRCFGHGLPASLVLSVAMLSYCSYFSIALCSCLSLFVLTKRFRLE